MNEKKPIVMRKAVLQEDEGREQVVDKEFTNREEAEKWISEQNEYFRPSDYYIKE